MAPAQAAATGNGMQSIAMAPSAAVTAGSLSARQPIHSANSADTRSPMPRATFCTHLLIFPLSLSLSWVLSAIPLLSHSIFHSLPCSLTLSLFRTHTHTHIHILYLIQSAFKPSPLSQVNGFTLSYGGRGSAKAGGSCGGGGS